MKTLKTYTNNETTFITKALDLLGIEYNLKRDVRNANEFVHDEISFSSTSEQDNLLGLLMKYNYEKNFN